MSVVLPAGPPGRLVHLIVPEGVDDPARPSGGNAYDRKLRQELRRRGLVVRQSEVTGHWPRPSASGLEAFARLLSSFEDGACLLVDGLVASAAGQVLGPHLRRLRVVVLVHLPFGVDDAAAREAEGTLFRAVGGLVTTSAWCRDWVVKHYGVPGLRVTVARPGAEPAPPAVGSATGSAGSELLCVAAVTPGKGHDVLLEALSMVSEPGRSKPAWRLTCVGPLDRSPDFVARVRDLADRMAPGRVRFTGPLAEDALGRVFSRSDLLVLPSRVETYGMVVTEALARGIPVIASRVGGVPEALGRADLDRAALDRPDLDLDLAASSPLRGDHGRTHLSGPENGALAHDHRGSGGGTGGVLVPADDPEALALALRTWLTDPDQRARLRAAARARRPRLLGWDETAARVAAALTAPDPTEPDPTEPDPAEPNLPRPRIRRVGAGELSYPSDSLSAGSPSAGPSATSTSGALDAGPTRVAFDEGGVR